MTDPVFFAAEQFLYDEAALLDARQWDDWLALYIEPCVYWAPAWIDEDTVTTDPRQQVSLIHYQSRTGLEERVQRIRSRQSIASTPLPRTVHAISNVRPLALADGAVRLRSVFAVDMWSLRRQEAERLFGTYEHELVRDGAGFRIARKTIVVLNDVLPSVVDIYSL